MSVQRLNGSGRYRVCAASKRWPETQVAQTLSVSVGSPPRLHFGVRVAFMGF